LIQKAAGRTGFRPGTRKVVKQETCMLLKSRQETAQKTKASDLATRKVVKLRAAACPQH
jgi:hypothetical protein